MRLQILTSNFHDDEDVCSLIIICDTYRLIQMLLCHFLVNLYSGIVDVLTDIGPTRPGVDMVYVIHKTFPVKKEVYKVHNCVDCLLTRLCLKDIISCVVGMGR